MGTHTHTHTGLLCIYVPLLIQWRHIDRHLYCYWSMRLRIRRKVQLGRCFSFVSMFFLHLNDCTTYFSEGIDRSSRCNDGIVGDQWFTNITKLETDEGGRPCWVICLSILKLWSQCSTRYLWFLIKSLLNPESTKHQKMIEKVIQDKNIFYFNKKLFWQNNNYLKKKLIRARIRWETRRWTPEFRAGVGF